MFKGIQKVSLIDFPNVISATIFTGGCNFRCPWCHNWDLVDPEKLKGIPDLPVEEVKDYLVGRKGKLQGVCVTGGEPTLWGDELADFFAWCHDEGFKTKLDTNGYLPGALKSYIEKGILDYIAMDIKNNFSKYAETVGLDQINATFLEKSIKLIKESGLDHRFRTTVVPGLVEAEEIDRVEEWLGEKIVRQEYRQIGKY